MALTGHRPRLSRPDELAVFAIGNGGRNWWLLATLASFLSSNRSLGSCRDLVKLGCKSKGGAK